MGFRRSDFPAKVYDFPIAEIDLSESELTSRFGPGVLPEPELFTFPGPVVLWAFEADDGQCIVLEHHLSKENMTVLCAEPKNAKLALSTLGVAPDRMTWEQTQEEITRFEMSIKPHRRRRHE